MSELDGGGVSVVVCVLKVCIKAHGEVAQEEAASGEDLNGVWCDVHHPFLFVVGEPC